MHDDEASVDAARAAAEQGRLGGWVADFLRSPGSDNAALAETFESQRLFWIGPVFLSFDELHRLAGPPDQPTLGRLEDDDLETVEGMEESVEEGWEPPPLIVSFRNGQLVVEDGTHRVEGLRRAGQHGYWSVVCFEEEDQRDRFIERVAAS
jgi:hypothetical protein